jgi:hypothetical protein
MLFWLNKWSQRGWETIQAIKKLASVAAAKLFGKNA